MRIFEFMTAQKWRLSLTFPYSKRQKTTDNANTKERPSVLHFHYLKTWKKARLLYDSVEKINQLKGCLGKILYEAISKRQIVDNFCGKVQPCAVLAHFIQIPQ